MGKCAIDQFNRCPICDKEYTYSNYHPACSKSCWEIWTEIIEHRGAPCWLDGCLEVSCGISAMTSESGHCSACRVFKTEQEIRRRGLDKGNLFGNY